MNRLRFSVPVLGAVSVLLFAAAAPAADSGRELFEQMIPPELALSRAAEIGLTAEQRDAVRGATAGLQARVSRLLPELGRERDALAALLRKDAPEEAAVLARFDKLAAVETELKRLRLQMSERTRALLTPEQRTRLQAAQLDRMSGPEGARRPGSLAAQLERVKAGIERWTREGRDVARVREAWDRFREAEARGFYRQARQALEDAEAILGEVPPPRAPPP